MKINVEHEPGYDSWVPQVVENTEKDTMISDETLLKAWNAMKPDRIQGFRYGETYVVRDVWLPEDQQQLWSGTDQEQFHNRCNIERMRLAYTAMNWT